MQSQIEKFLEGKALLRSGDFDGAKRIFDELVLSGCALGHIGLANAYLRVRQMPEFSAAVRSAIAEVADDDAEAWYEIANLYSRGVVGPDFVSDKLARMRHLTRAAELGYPLAQHELAVLFDRGDSVVSADSEMFEFWIWRAIEGGSRIAAKYLESKLLSEGREIPERLRLHIEEDG